VLLRVSCKTVVVGDVFCAVRFLCLPKLFGILDLVSLCVSKLRLLVFRQASLVLTPFFGLAFAFAFCFAVGLIGW